MTAVEMMDLLGCVAREIGPPRGCRVKGPYLLGPGEAGFIVERTEAAKAFVIRRIMLSNRPRQIVDLYRSRLKRAAASL